MLMQLSEKHISDFQKLYKNRFGEDIPKEIALEKGLSVLKIVRRVVTVPLKKEDNEKDE